MPQFGSNPSVSSQNFSATQDANGNSIISSDSSFAASPLGLAARTQALFGIPNANFDLTCPEPNNPVEVDNSIPYWGLESNGDIVTTMTYNTTTQNWSVRMDPTGAASGDSVILKTRTYLLNDDALALRQKAFASLTRQGTTGTAQWSIVLSATYFDEAGTQLSTYNIGTAADTGTWTGINGITTSGSAAISTTAAYADIALTLTAAGSVSGTAKVDVNSVLIATSQTGTTFQVIQTFLSSGTFTVPTGVEYVTIVAAGGGKGGDGGELSATNTTTTGLVQGGNGGSSGQWALIPNVSLGTAATVAVGVGAGGIGGTANTFSKGTAVSTTSAQNQRVGAAGGASSFGSFISVPGGAVTAGTVTFGFYSVGGGTANQANRGAGGAATLAQKNGDASVLSATTLGAPFTPDFVSTGAAGVAGTGSGGGSGTASSGGVAQAVIGILGGGAGGGQGTASSSSSIFAGGVGGAGGAASGGGAAMRYISANAQTIVVTGGAGGTASASTGSGGGGGGAVGVAAASSGNYTASTITANSGKGGDGAAGFVVVAYIA